jgi:hypothetical protein
MKTVSRLFLLLVIAFLWAQPALSRPSISLDGQWECVWGKPDSLPAADAPWETVPVPSVREWRPEGPHCLWYRRRFSVPAAWAGTRVVLRFGGIKFSQRVYVNGKEVGNHLGGFEPTEYDITDQLVRRSPGEGQTQPGASNQLLVAAQDWSALLAEGAEAAPPQLSGDFGSWVRDGILSPIGSHGSEVGIWDSVSVESRPSVSLADVFVIPSVREGVLRVQVTVQNSLVRDEQVTVTARISGGGEGPRFAPQQGKVSAKGSSLLTLEARWPNAHLWSPQDPHLYNLIVGLRSQTQSESQEIRFGFREFWVEGDRFFLNGTPIHLLATASHPLTQYDANPHQAYDMAQSVGCVAMRLHAQPWPHQWYDAADEDGMLLVWESALWCLSPNYALSRDEFWKNARDHITAQIKLQRNHPSVVIWSAENELLDCGGDSVKGTDGKLGGLADLIRELDPTRPVMFEGDGDPVGKADIVNLHYPHELGRWNRWPETAYWLEVPTPLDTYPNGTWQWDRKKPLYVGEFLWMPPSEEEAASILLGEATYPDLDASRQLAKAATWEMQVKAFRSAGVAGMCPWTLWETGEFPNVASEANRRAYQAIAAFTREASTRVFAGTTVARTITVLNDSPDPHSLELRWRLTPEAGGWQVSGSAPVALAAAGRARVTAYLALPPIAEPVAPARYTVELWEGGSLLFTDFQQWKVYGRQQLSGPVRGAPKAVAILDPVGDTSRLLGELGVECLPLDSADARRTLRFSSVAVIGRGAFPSAGPQAPAGGADQLSDALLSFVRQGGTLIVFEQQQYPPSLLPVSLADHSSTIAFVRAHGHPALAGLDDGDLAQWLPDEIVSRKEIANPTGGGFLPIVDSGGPEGLSTSALAELRLGRGRILLCQLAVTDKGDASPPATRLVRNLLSYAAQPPPPPAAVGVVSGDALPPALDAIGLRYDRIAKPLQKSAFGHHQVLLITDLARVQGAEPRLKQFVRSGGTVVLHRITPADVPRVAAVLGQPIILQSGSGTGVTFTDRTGPAAAMSNQDLAWLGPSPTDSAPPSVSDRTTDYVMLPAYRETGPAIKLQAEQMTLPSFGASLDQGEEGSAVELYTNAEVTARITVPLGGTYLISLHLRGTPAGGGWPQASVRVDDASLGTLVADSEQWQTFSLIGNLPAGDHTLGIGFTNDFYALPEDRNLWVDWASLTPITLQKSSLIIHTSPGVLASLPDGKGLWIIDQVRWDAPGGSGERAQRYLANLLTSLGCPFAYESGTVIEAAAMQVKDCELCQQSDGSVTLATSGVLETEVEFASAGDYVIAVRAEGTPVDGVYPQIEVKADGKALGVLQLEGSGWQTKRLRAAVAAGKHLLSLGFINDEWKPPQDRNLTISRLTISKQG